MNGLDLKHRGVSDTLAADTAPHRLAAPHIRAEIQRLADTGATFTAEDVRERLTPDVLDKIRDRPNVLPAVFAAVARTGAIVPTGSWRVPTRASRHGNPLREWRAA